MKVKRPENWWRRGAYLRTSTTAQDGETQQAQLRQWIATRWEGQAKWWKDVGVSGKRASRPGLDALLAAVRAGELRELVVPSIDRLGRSTKHILLLMDELMKAGVVVHSLREGTLDATSPVGRAVWQFMAVLAEMEHALIRERVVAGQARAKAAGVHLGRKKKDIPPEVLLRAWKLKRQGQSWRDVAQAVGVKVRTLRDHLADGLPGGKLPKKPKARAA